MQTDAQIDALARSLARPRSASLLAHLVEILFALSPSVALSRVCFSNSNRLKRARQAAAHPKSRLSRKKYGGLQLEESPFVRCGRAAHNFIIIQGSAITAAGLARPPAFSHSLENCMCALLCPLSKFREPRNYETTSRTLLSKICVSG